MPRRTRRVATASDTTGVSISPCASAAAAAATAAAAAMRPRPRHGRSRETGSRIDRPTRTRPRALATAAATTVASAAPTRPNHATRGTISATVTARRTRFRPNSARVSARTRSTASTAMTGRSRPSDETTNTGTLPRVPLREQQHDEGMRRHHQEPHHRREQERELPRAVVPDGHGRPVAARAQILGHPHHHHVEHGCRRDLDERDLQTPDRIDGERGRIGPIRDEVLVKARLDDLHEAGKRERHRVGELAAQEAGIGVEPAAAELPAQVPDGRARTGSRRRPRRPRAATRARGTRGRAPRAGPRARDRGRRTPRTPGGSACARP